MIFKTPIALIIIPVFLAAFFILRAAYKERAIIFPTGDVVKLLGGSLKVWLARRLIYLRVAAIILVILALARPQAAEETRLRKEGIAIMLATDCSSTMLAEDLELGPLGLAPLVGESREGRRLNRMDAVKKVAAEFIKARPDDMIGIVAFAAQAYIVCPPTFDKEWLLSSLERVKVGLIRDATAIGSGILACLESLKGVKARSKVIILLTDGINNFGEVPPLVAAKAARALGVKIYAVGIASRGQTPFPTKDASGRRIYENIRIDIDESTLRSIAEITGGNYYRVNDMRGLKASYAEIDRLEKAGIEEMAYEEYKDVFPLFLGCALILLLLEIVLGNTFLRKIP